MSIHSYKNIHCIGIGGIGVSAMAQWFLAQGKKVTGSNLVEEPILNLEIFKSLHISVGPHKAENIPTDTDLVVYSLAVPENNLERAEARKRGIPEISYPQALGELTKEMYTIAIAGSHGKSTTTALTALTLVEAGLDPTVIIGTKLKEFNGTNFRAGKSKYLVIEADEWAGAFWNYYPNIAVVLNIDKEHLDFYKNFEGVQESFKNFLGNLKPNGVAIVEYNNPELAEKIKKVMQIPGEHNVSNTLAVMKVAEALKISKEIVLKVAGAYRGSWRRFEYKGKLNGADVYDDYGHHPTEIKATLKATKEKFPDKRLVCVYQPHQYQRTKYLFDDFVTAFDDADVLVLLEVYGVAGREDAASQKTAEDLFHAIEKRGTMTVHYHAMEKAAEFLKEHVTEKNIVLIMGAGDVWKIYAFLSFENKK